MAARCRTARPGELVVRGPSAAEGYWNQREKTRRTFRGEWTYTGDTYTRDAEGYFRYCGRSDEMLKVSGIWVSPFEVEEALVSHPAVLEAAVVGATDHDGLTKPRAFVILQEAAKQQDAGNGEGTAEDACEGADRRVEISALDRVRRRLCRRPPPARSNAFACGMSLWKTPPACKPEPLRRPARRAAACEGRSMTDHLLLGVPPAGNRLVGPWPRPMRPRWSCCTKAWAASPCGATFPPLLADATGCGVFAYSRFGYGQSDPKPLPWPLTYMQDEARDVLPRVLDAAGIREAILIGHSDGGSIAAVYAGSARRSRCAASC